MRIVAMLAVLTFGCQRHAVHCVNNDGAVVLHVTGARLHDVWVVPLDGSAPFLAPEDARCIEGWMK